MAWVTWRSTPPIHGVVRQGHRGQARLGVARLGVAGQGTFHEKGEGR